MKKKQPKLEKAPLPTQDKSFPAAIEQMAELLRTEVKLKERDTKVLSSSSMPHSFNIAIVKVARLLRTQARAVDSTKKHSWKAGFKPDKPKG